MELDEKGIAIGNTPEARKARKKYITDFYVQWNMANTTKRIYNISLKSFIEVRFLSINETSRIASYRYKSPTRKSCGGRYKFYQMPFTVNPYFLKLP